MTQFEAFRHPINLHSLQLSRSLGLPRLEYQSPWAQLAAWTLRRAERMDFDLEEAIEALDAAPRDKALLFLLEDAAHPGQLQELEGFLQEGNPLAAGRLLLRRLQEMLVQKLGEHWDPSPLWQQAPPAPIWA